MPSVFRKRKASASVSSRSSSTAAAVKDAFAGDESLLQLHAETAELLRLVKSPTPARQRAPTKARVTIEVLDDDDDDDDESNAASVSLASPLSPATETASQRASAPRPSADPVAFSTEEARVRGARDTFYPDTTSTKQALDRQQNALASEQSRLQRLARGEQSEGERKRQEVERHQRHKLPSRLETSAVKVRLCERVMQSLSSGAR